jgi:3-deoxy-D-arabino-heptulosonate 7-phosphate (DAHP) synthase
LPARKSRVFVVTSPAVCRHWGPALEESLQHAKLKYQVGWARTLPYSFQGLREASDHFGLLKVSEVMEASQIPAMLPYIGILQMS